MSAFLVLFLLLLTPLVHAQQSATPIGKAPAAKPWEKLENVKFKPNR